MHNICAAHKFLECLRAAHNFVMIGTHLSAEVGESATRTGSLNMTSHELTSHAVEYRKLWPTELDLFRAHLLRLDPETRRMRFGRGVGDAFLETYCNTAYSLNSLVYGCFVDGTLRAVSELRLLTDTWPFEAELAFSVEDPWQDSGIGTELMGRALRAARNRGIGRLYMICLPENGRMRKVAKKYDALLAWKPGEIEGNLYPPFPDYFSVLHEFLDDTSGLVTFMLDLGHNNDDDEPLKKSA